MSKKTSQRKMMERVMAGFLLADTALFAGCLVVSGLGIGWAKILLAILTGLTALLGLTSLHLTRELYRPRSRYLAVGFAAVLVCLVVSLAVNYPSPAPELPKYTDPASGAFFTGIPM